MAVAAKEATGTLEYQWSTQTSEPPTGSQIRADNDDQTLATLLWIRDKTSAGSDVRNGLLAVPVGSTMYLQDWDSSTLFQRYRVEAEPVAKTDYVEFAVSWLSGGDPLTGQKIGLIVFTPEEAGPGPAPGPTGDYLVTVEQARLHCLRDGTDDSMDYLWELLIPMVSEAATLWADRQFAPIDDVARTVWGGGAYVSFSPWELRTPTTVEDGAGGLLAADDYTLLPFAGTLQGTYLSMAITIGVDGPFTVTGDWGMAKVPPTVQLACLIALDSYYRNPSAHGSESLGSYSFTEVLSQWEIGGLPRASRSLLDNFRRISVT